MDYLLISYLTHPILCLLMNLLQRGNPTDFSDYLNTQFEINKNNGRYGFIVED